MRSFDAAQADVLVFTYKEGLLSAVAHDLKIRVTRFSIEIDEEAKKVRARFDARSLRVVTAMRDGQDAYSALSDDDKRKIEAHIVDDVLRVKQFPDIVFESSRVEERETGYHVRGKLTLCGQTREIALDTRSDGEGQVMEALLHQPHWGVKPFSAMLGTLKIKPDVAVRVAILGLL